MSIHKGVEAWIEDSQHKKTDCREILINLVDSDDRTVTVKTEMSRDELYTVHCRSPVSVLCDVFIIAGSQIRNNAARFYLDKSLAGSKSVTGSSMNHNIDQFRELGLRTPKRQIKKAGKLCTVEVEIRRIGEIIKGGPGEGADMDFIMVDEPNQPPWLVFRFEIGAKRSRSATRPTLLRKIRTAGPSEEPPRHLHEPKKRSREHDGSDPDLLREYQEEEAEECRLLRKLQGRIQDKRARNDELRRMLGETE